MKIWVKVKPNSIKQEIIRLSEFNYLVNVKSKAEKGKANLETLKLLSKYFKKKCSLIAGNTPQNKIINIAE